jgi:hypothetical protein
MNLRSRSTRFAISFAAALSLIAGGVAVPATAASSTGVSAAAGISAKKKVLTAEQKKAKKALDKAVADLQKLFQREIPQRWPLSSAPNKQIVGSQRSTPNHGH